MNIKAGLYELLMKGLDGQDHLKTVYESQWKEDIKQKSRYKKIKKKQSYNVYNSNYLTVS